MDTLTKRSSRHFPIASRKGVILDDVPGSEWLDRLGKRGEPLRKVFGLTLESRKASPDQRVAEVVDEMPIRAFISQDAIDAAVR